MTEAVSDLETIELQSRFQNVLTDEIQKQIQLFSHCLDLFPKDNVNLKSTLNDFIPQKWKSKLYLDFLNKNPEDLTDEEGGAKFKYSNIKFDKAVQTEIGHEFFSRNMLA